MSEFSLTKEARVARLMEIARLILKTGNAQPLINDNADLLATVVPSDFITLFDEVVKEGYNMSEIKVLTNKLINVFHVSVRDYHRIAPQPDSFLDVLEKNNAVMAQSLQNIRPVFKAFIKDVNNTALRFELDALFEQLDAFAKYYTIKENILFPVLEAAWPDHRCVQIMWSFHDDIRRNLKAVRAQLQAGISDLPAFNRSVGDLFFNMLAIKFREEHILFPAILSSLNERQLNALNHEAVEMGYPYVQPALVSEPVNNEAIQGSSINLGTGTLSVDQIKLIFNHLPVDITFVDDNNKVCYFSTPPKRIFPRTISIIGREVNRCHPPESVHVVEKIVESFRSGEKSHADFWIKMKGEYILIQYFAVRDEQGTYKGVIEVTQEISHIKALEGEKRLLDW